MAFFNRPLAGRFLSSKSAKTMLLCVALCIAACRPETSRITMVETLEHPRGLISKRPFDMQATPTTNGFMMTDTQAKRNPLELEISLLPPSASKPAIAPHYFGLFGMRYIVSTTEGGSGGTQYTIEALRPLGTCWITLVARQQSEQGEASFLTAWAVLSESTAAANAGC